MAGSSTAAISAIADVGRSAAMAADKSLNFIVGLFKKLKRTGDISLNTLHYKV
jgi:hypothetical protein